MKTTHYLILNFVFRVVRSEWARTQKLLFELLWGPGGLSRQRRHESYSDPWCLLF